MSTTTAPTGEKSSQPPLYYAVHLDEGQLEYIRSKYPGYDLRQASRPKSHDHPVSHMIRVIENMELTQLTNKRYVDIGGKTSRYAHRKLTKVHVCQPILSGEDEVRAAEQHCPAHVSFCRNKGECCDVPADELMSVDVLYFQNPDTICQALLAHGCKVYTCSVNNIFDGEGTINFGEVRYICENGMVTQTNLETGHTYVHKDLSWIFRIKNYRYGGRYLNFEITKRSFDRVRVKFTLTDNPFRVKINLNPQHYEMLTFSTWRNNWTGSRCYRATGSRYVAFDHDLVNYLSSKYIAMDHQKLNQQLLEELKSVNIRGYHYQGKRAYVKVPIHMFKVYAMITKETVLQERVQFELADNALEELRDTLDNVKDHVRTFRERFRRYAGTWKIYQQTNRLWKEKNPNDHSSDYPDPSLLREHTVEHLPTPVVPQTEMSVDRWHPKETYQHDDGIHYIGPVPLGTQLYVPTQNCEELRAAFATRADNKPKPASKAHHDAMLHIMERCVLKGQTFEPVRWTFQGFCSWASKFSTEKQKAYIRIMDERMCGDLERLDALAPEVRELRKRDLFCKMEALYKLDSETEETEVKPRLIISSQDIVNIYYGPIFEQVKLNLKSCLNGTPYVYTDGNTPQDNADLIGAHYELGDDICENDYSKYDKTQGEWLRKAEFHVFRALGLDLPDSTLWEETTRSAYMNYMYKFKADIEYQRQTGDPTTSLGNSLTNLMVSLLAYHNAGVDVENDIKCMAVLGDDNITIMKGDTMTQARIATFERVNAECGLVAKYAVKRDLAKSEYCSTGFIMTSHGRIAAIPKIGKALVRMNVRSKYNPLIDDDTYIDFKRAAWMVCNANNPLGRKVAAMYDLRKLPYHAASTTLNAYEYAALCRKVSRRHELPHVSDDDMRKYLNDRYENQDLEGLLNDVETMHASNTVRHFAQSPLLRKAALFDQ